MENFASSVVVAVVAAFVTFQLSIRQFRSERWWELKIAAYQKIIEAFHGSKKFLDLNYEEQLGIRKISDELDKSLREKSAVANEEIYKAIDIGGFLLSDAALNRLKQYKKESEEASKHDSWFEYLDHAGHATDTCLIDLIALAKEDLNESHVSRLKGYFLQLSRLIKKRLERDGKATKAAKK